MQCRSLYCGDGDKTFVKEYLQVAEKWHACRNQKCWLRVIMIDLCSFEITVSTLKVIAIWLEYSFECDFVAMLIDFVICTGFSKSFWNWLQSNCVVILIDIFDFKAILEVSAKWLQYGSTILSQTKEANISRKSIYSTFIWMD